jgi:hypothetical protein
MSITLTGTGGLFTRLGKIYRAIRDLNYHRGNGLLRAASLSGNGSTSTFTTQYPHGFTTGDTVTVAGGSISTFNGSFTITVTSTTAFTYSSAANGSSTGTPTVRKTAGVGGLNTGADVDAIEAQYQSTDQNLIDSLYSSRNSYRVTQSQWTSALQSVAQSTVIQMMDEVSPLVSKDLKTALTALIASMGATSDSVKKPTASVSVAAGGSNHSNGVCTASILGPNGLQMDYVLGEALTLTCTSDSQGNATAGSEPLSIKGATAQPDPLQWDYPLSSGVSTSTTAVDASLNQQLNLLFNSGFDTFTVSNTPDNWTIATGSAGTTVFDGSTGQAFKGDVLKITGNGSELTSLTQSFNQTSGGNTYKLLPSTVYAINFWTKVSAVPSGGVLEVSLIDGSGTIIQNAQSVDNKIQVTLSGETTSYAAHSAYFQTPTVLPASTPYKIRVRLSTAMDNAKSVYVDHLAMAIPKQVYSGGPYVTVFSGSSTLILGDTFTPTVSQANDSQWQLAMDQLCNMRALGLQIPSSGSPTVAESLIS